MRLEPIDRQVLMRIEILMKIKSSSRGDTGFNEGQKMETLKELNILRMEALMVMGA